MMEAPNLNDPLEARRKRCSFRALRRGTRESDMLIGGFAKRYLPELDELQLERFEALLERNDPEVLSWIVGVETVPAEFDHDVMALLKSYKISISGP